MPDDNILDFDTARRSQRAGKQPTYEALAKLDELETLLETMDEFGVSSREELVDLIARLEAEIDPNH